jgi:hypothetical protein
MSVCRPVPRRYGLRRVLYLFHSDFVPTMVAGAATGPGLAAVLVSSGSPLAAEQAQGAGVADGLCPAVHAEPAI